MTIKRKPPMRMRQALHAFLLLLMVQILLPSPARAIPAFARTHEAPCTLCHAGYPKLNQFGMEFLQRGYRMPGEEGRYLWKQPLPLSGRIDLSYQYVRNEWKPQTPFSIGGFPPLKNTWSSNFALDDWQLLAGGTVAPNISFMVQIVGIAERRGPDLTDDLIIIQPGSKTAAHSGGLIPLPGAPTLEADTFKTEIQTEQLFVQADDLVAEGGLNLRAGRYHVDNHLLSEPHRLTLANYLIQIQPILGPTLLSTTEGMEANGMLPGKVRYAVGLRNFGPQYDSKEGKEQHVGAYYGILSRMSGSASLAFIISGDRVGDANLSADDSTLAYGIASDFRLGPLEVSPGVFRYTEGGQIRTGRRLNVTSGTVGATYALRSNLLATARIDALLWDLAHDTSDRRARQYVASLSWYPYPLVRLALEYSRLESKNLVLISLPEGQMFLPAFSDVDYTQNVLALLFQLAF